MVHRAELAFGTSPVMVAAWPGVGSVGLLAVDYLRTKLHAKQFAQVDMRPFFVPTSVPVKEGRMMAPRMPRSGFHEKHSPDMIIFESTAQVSGRDALMLLRGVVGAAKSYGVSRILTVGAFPRPVSHRNRPLLYYGCSDEALVAELSGIGMRPLPEGEITGPAGLLPRMAAEEGIEAACMLAGIPQYAGSASYPKGSLEIIRALSKLLRFDVDISEVQQAVDATEGSFEQLEEEIRERMPGMVSDDDDEDDDLTPGAGSAPVIEESEVPKPKELPAHIRAKIELLFGLASHDKGVAQELKRELDRWEVFPDYEDRFLDLFGD